MLYVGIRELKSKLSSYLDRVKDGEEVIVTDRGNEVALFKPISREHRAITLLVESGKVKWKGSKPKGLKGIKIKGKSIAETVLEERR